MEYIPLKNTWSADTLYSTADLKNTMLSEASHKAAHTVPFCEEARIGKPIEIDRLVIA